MDNKCNINNLKENLYFLNRSAVNLNKAVDEFIKIDCSNLQIKKYDRFEALIKNRKSLEDLIAEIKNFKKKQVQDKSSDLMRLYKEYSKIRGELTQYIDPLTIDLLISADEISRNDVFLPRDHSCMFYLKENKEAKK